MANVNDKRLYQGPADGSQWLKMLQDIQADLAALRTLANELKADFNNHCHNADGAQAGSYFTSRPRSDASTVTAGTAQTVDAADVSLLTKTS